MHFRQGTLLSHLTFNREHSSQACRFRPRSNELGMAEFPLRSHRLKWSRRTSLPPRKVNEAFSDAFEETYLRLKVLEQNLQLYGRSPESVIGNIRSYPRMYEPERMRGREEAHAAADAAADGLCAGTSCHIDCRSIGFEPPFCRNHCGGTSGGKGDRERCIWGSWWATSHILPKF